MIDILWDIHQERRIGEAQDRADGASRQAENAKQENRYLRRSVEKLALTNMAMWELLRERLRLSDEDLMAKMQEIDLRDGVADGRVTQAAAVTVCSKCARKLAPRHERCLYCGEANAGHAPFAVR